ncbi:hypothetical protein H1S01_15460 [Heliobacterium chlorum]|uniref:Uncharacterized protein n=1 Tax=Heliobacterium chlorum TaxID=2698 RepID=A0ABR7T539_HELCL|nr:hypothetical protein [Heliobacterium chlorum]MBC9785883.1 hypothetical protein [Heliobacterium chlorum]
MLSRDKLLKIVAFILSTLMIPLLLQFISDRGNQQREIESLLKQANQQYEIGEYKPALITYETAIEKMKTENVSYEKKKDAAKNYFNNINDCFSKVMKQVEPEKNIKVLESLIFTYEFLIKYCDDIEICVDPDSDLDNVSPFIKKKVDLADLCNDAIIQYNNMSLQELNKNKDKILKIIKLGNEMYIDAIGECNLEVNSKEVASSKIINQISAKQIKYKSNFNILLDKLNVKEL